MLVGVFAMAANPSRCGHCLIAASVYHSAGKMSIIGDRSCPRGAATCPVALAVNLAPKIAEPANGLRAFDFMICLRDSRGVYVLRQGSGLAGTSREFVQTRSSVSGRFFV